jgi:tRNA pseudouridine55 synthase
VTDGLLVVDKPAGWTSHDVVARVRRLAGTRKVGHAGTLDPMATGVLVLGIDKGTRLLTFLVGTDKEYAATIRLGVATSTDDAEGEVLAAVDAAALTEADVVAAMAPLTGPIQQVPSSVSAIKVDGRRAYARVRAGEAVELAARSVTVHRFDLFGTRPGARPDGLAVLDADVVVHCSSGTYVRALARDLGEALGVGGHLTALRRTRVGGCGLDVARTLDQLEAEFTFQPLADAARATFAVRELTEDEARDLSHGKRIVLAPSGPSGTTTSPVAAFAPDGTLVALLADDGGRSRPVLVLAPA